MKTKDNMPFYLVVFAVLTEDYKPLNHITLKKGESLVVDQDATYTPGYDKPTDVFVKKKGTMGYDVYKVPMNKLRFKVKKLVPKFKVGEVVIDNKSQRQDNAFRVASYNQAFDSIWYQDNWGHSQGLASGRMEYNIRKATPQEIEFNKSGIDYYDSLKKKVA